MDESLEALENSILAYNMQRLLPLVQSLSHSLRETGSVDFAWTPFSRLARTSWLKVRSRLHDSSAGASKQAASADFKKKIVSKLSQMLCAAFEPALHGYLTPDSLFTILGTISINATQLPVRRFDRSFLLRIGSNMQTSDPDILACLEFLEHSNSTAPFEYPIISAIYPLHACINHSCVPNTEVSVIWASPTASTPRFPPSVMLKTTKNVAADEELCISYLGASHKKSALKLLYGFQCQCPACIS